MRQIYVSAVQVNVWLGEEGDAKNAMEFCKTLRRAIAYGQLESYDWDDELGNAWGACWSLFYERPWWTRMWVVQEVLHPGDVVVYLGQLQVELKELCVMYKRFSVFPARQTKLHLTHEFHSKK
jgi:hypothetical protein